MVDAFSTAFSNILLRVSLPAAASCLVLVGLGGAWLMLRNVSRRIRRAFGVVTLMFLGLWVLAMGGSGSYPTRDEKEQNRALQTEIAAERAAIASLMLAGGTPRQQSGYGPMQSIPSWEHGIYEDGARIVFPDGWVFPFGSNHLASVEVMAWGEVFPDGFSRSQVAAFGPRLSMVPGVSSFHYGMTSSNSCAFVWSSARVGRINGEPFDGRIELFRNGDVSVTTNGVAAFLPRTLPFLHSGFGQDDEWVTANFTNATEILAVGYPQWVDAQVGEGLTNGLYKLSVTVADDPPETTFLSVGNLSVAVTNAGEYVFLLGKGIDYPLSVFPETATNFAYTAVDDIPSVRTLPMRGTHGDLNDGWWTRDEGYLELVVPIYPLVPFSPSAHIAWAPALSVSPANWQPSEWNDSETFVAILSDVPWFVSSSFSWNTSDPSIVSISTPAVQSTQMTAHYPAADTQQVALSLEADVGDCTLHSYYVTDPEGQGGGPGVSLTISLPEFIFVNDDDDNDDGSPDCLVTFPDDDDIVSGSIQFNSPQPTNGTIVVEGIYGYDGGFGEMPLVYANSNCTDAITSGRMFAVSGVSELSQPIYLNPATVSTSVPGVQIKVRWHPESGPDLTASAFLTIVSPVAEPVCNAVTNVVENGVEHSYVVNPCGVAVGREGYFRVDVAPDSFPDSEIVWEKTPGLDFVGSCTGRCVTVRGASTGYETLSVQIGGRTNNTPEFNVRVVEMATVNLRAWIIEDSQEQLRPIEPNGVRQMVKDANDIYAQVGVTLNLIEPIVVTNIPDAYNAFYDAPASPTSTWTFDQIVYIDSDTGGLECYFINRFVDSEKTVAANSAWGAVITKQADCKCFAHEIGHAFGMSDIYVESTDATVPPAALQASDWAAYSCMSNDWNGGCHGHNRCGARYYAPQTSMERILSRMLMKGTNSAGSGQVDITSGDVYGVYYTYDANHRKIWHKGAAPVAAPWIYRNPAHQ